jgi:hypothetical protein
MTPPTMAGMPVAQQSNPWGPQGYVTPEANQAWQQGYPPNQPPNQLPNQPGPGQPQFAFGQPPQPFFPQPPQPPQQPPKKGGGRNAGLAVVAIVVVAAIIAGIFLLTHKKSGGDHVANAGQTSAPGGASASFPSFNAPSSAGHVTTTAPASTPSPDQSSDTGADGASLDEQGTDQTPFAPASFFPETFTDDGGTTYTRQADGPAQCHQQSASSTMNNILSANGCKQMVNASYVDGDGKILVSVVTYAFADADHASGAFKAIQAKHGIDMGLWCPESGEGSSPCNASSDAVHAASSYEWYQQDHRYLTTAVAIHIDLSTDTSLQTAESAAAKAAVYACGPQYYLGQGN